MEGKESLLNMTQDRGLQNRRHFDEDNLGGMNPMLLPRPNNPFKVPALMYSSAPLVNAPLPLKRSTEQTAIYPSTLRIEVSFLNVVAFSTASA